jgi:anthranilate synthase component 1
MRMTSFEEFRELAARGTFVPVWKELLADLLTPASAFLKIAEHSDYAFLFESVEGAEQVGRYSFLGKDPFLVLRSRQGHAVVERAGERTSTGQPFLTVLGRLMADFSALAVPELPRFTGGAVGLLGYDFAARLHQVSGSEQAATVPDTDDDEAVFMFCDTVLAFDHVRHRILIISNARLTPGDDLEALYRFACARIEFVERELRRPLSQEMPGDRDLPHPKERFTRSEFERIAGEAKRRIADKAIDYVMLSQRFDVVVTSDPFTVYRALRHVSPAPYMYFLRTGTHSVVGSSPETLVQVEQGHVQTHPLTGTRPRGRSPAEDLALAEELRRDERERQEHTLLTERARQDLARVSRPGSVRVSGLMNLEQYSNVMHLVSIVEGQLADGCQPIDALASCFPAASVSGSPTASAMRVIAELETAGRGMHAGAVGYVDFAGNLDFCIGMPSIVMSRGHASWECGVLITPQSTASRKYEEMRQRAATVFMALGLAERGLQPASSANSERVVSGMR